MATGTYKSAKRVERNGRLVAFEGEEMTMDEAIQRGLVKEPKPKASAKGKAEGQKPEEETKEPDEDSKEA